MLVAGGGGPPTNVGPVVKPADELASDAASGCPTGTRASGFEKGSEREPSKSISTADVAGVIPFDVAGAAIQIFEDNRKEE